MSVWAVTMARDEADVIEGTLRHISEEGVAGIIVADNGSNDGTRDILEALAGRGATLTAAAGQRLVEPLDCELVVVDDPDPAYYQSTKMTGLAARAAERGATWIVPFDADELWYAHDAHLADVLDALPETVTAAHAVILNHFPSAIDPPGTDPFETIVWRQPSPAPLAKVAFRWQHNAVIHQGNHGVTLPTPGEAATVLELRHFPYRSFEQFRRKALNGAAAYAATDLPVTEGAHWRQYGALHTRHGDDALREVFTTWFWHLAPVEAGLIEDPAPYLRWR